MKRTKRWTALIIASVLAAQCIPVIVSASDIPFTDVTVSDWYYADVSNAYNMGLIDGRTNSSFAPDEHMTHAEAVKLAACMHQVYTKDAPFVANCTPWYEIYADYCYQKGIINREYPWDTPITRGAYIDIFSRALPKEALSEINRVDDGMIPDVAMSHRYAKSIYTMYRAGIVQGQDETKRCAPDSYVKRGEVAAILSRMMDISQRVPVTLIDLSKLPQSPENTTPIIPPSGGNTTPNYPSYPSYPNYPYYPPIGGGSTDPEPDAPSTDDATQEEPTVVLPWENGGKQPSEYTWAEYEALTPSLQIAFQNSFGSTEAFENWMDQAQGNDSGTENIPWENGGKQPGAYTWAEYETLTPGLQMAFQNSFGSAEAFEAWASQAQGNSTNIPWENGGKQPSEYTWVEFETLSPALQMAFQNSFGSTEAFEAWMNRVQNTTPSLPWESGGKQPSEYTWAEFEALSPALQMAFQNSFGSTEAFEAWMNRVQNTTSILPWENGGKQPSEYTWDEFEALPIDLQMAFQNSFASIDEFEKWINAVNP